MQPKVQTIIDNLLFFLELQLCISIFSLPFFIAWGLPISSMSILGNLIFGQFLNIFIALSACLCILHSFNLPYTACANSLSWITDWWYIILSYGSTSWLYALPFWLLPVSIVCCCVTYALYAIKNKQYTLHLGLLFFISCIPYSIHILTFHMHTYAQIKQGKSLLYLIKVHGEIYAFDQGALSARPSCQSFIEFTLLPTLIQTMGATWIDTLIIYKKNSRTDKAIKYLCQHIKVKQIIYIQQKTISCKQKYIYAYLIKKYT